MIVILVLFDEEKTINEGLTTFSSRAPRSHRILKLGELKENKMV